MTKKIVNSIIVIALLGVLAFGINEWIYPLVFPCNRPIEYRIGTIDPQFGLTKEKAQAAAEKAGTIWSQSAGKVLFRYDPNARLTIHFTYDQRHEEAIKRRQLETKIAAEEEALTKLSQNYDDLRTEYLRLKTDYEAAVDYWNAQGGAPPEEYAQLESQRERLNNLAVKLNNAATANNQKVETVLQDVTVYNRDAGKIYEQGVYEVTGLFQRSITVFTFDDQRELVFILTHELGHALGIPHIEDPRAIMTSVHREQASSEPTITDADRRVLEATCRLSSV